MTDLAHIRNQLRLTQSELAYELCVTLRTVQRYERSGHVPRSVQWALLELHHRIARYHGDVDGDGELN
jgi:DNA-binding transcriptional regulator YiaG